MNAKAVRGLKLGTRVPVLTHGSVVFVGNDGTARMVEYFLGSQIKWSDFLALKKTDPKGWAVIPAGPLLLAFRLA